MGLINDIIYSDVYSNKYEEEMNIIMCGKIVYEGTHSDINGNYRVLEYNFVETENNDLELKITCLSTYKCITKEELEDSIICLYKEKLYVYYFYKIDYTEYDDLLLFYKQIEKPIELSDNDKLKINVLGLNVITEELLKGLYNKYKKKS